MSSSSSDSGSTQSPSSAATSSLASGSSFSIPHITHLVTVKLTDSNYLLWCSQMKPFLIGQNFWRFIDGSYPQPPEFFFPNIEYFSWHRTDQTLINLINATLSELILGMVVGLHTSCAIWTCLEHHFSQQSVANASTLQFRLLYLLSSHTRTEWSNASTAVYLRWPVLF